VRLVPIKDLIQMIASRLQVAPWKSTVESASKECQKDPKDQTFLTQESHPTQAWWAKSWICKGSSNSRVYQQNLQQKLK